MSNRRQRLRTMLTPAPICLEGNTSPCMTYSLAGYDWIGCHMTTGDARGYSRYSPSGCYGAVTGLFRPHLAIFGHTKVCPYALRVAFCHPQSAVSSSYTTCDTGVCQLEYGRTAIGVRAYGNCDTVRICHYGCWKQPLMAVTEIYSGLQRIYDVGAPCCSLR